MEIISLVDTSVNEYARLEMELLRLELELLSRELIEGRVI